MGCNCKKNVEQFKNLVAKPVQGAPLAQPQPQQKQLTREERSLMRGARIAARAARVAARNAAIHKQRQLEEEARKNRP